MASILVFGQTHFRLSSSTQLLLLASPSCSSTEHTKIPTIQAAFKSRVARKHRAVSQLSSPLSIRRLTRSGPGLLAQPCKKEKRTLYTRILIHTLHTQVHTYGDSCSYRHSTAQRVNLACIRSTVLLPRNQAGRQERGPNPHRAKVSNSAPCGDPKRRRTARPHRTHRICRSPRTSVIRKRLQ